MTCAHFVLSLICLLNSNSFFETLVQQSDSKIIHPGDSVTLKFNVGDSVTLQCLYDDDDGGNPLFFWYKQPLRQEPKLISTQFAFDRKGTFHDEFKDEIRFTLKNEKYSLILTIYDVQVSDSATYYCAKSMPSYSLEFSEGTTVFVKVADFFINALVQQSDSKTIHPGDSVTLKCTASTGSCDAEPSENKTHTCVYNLSLNNLNQSNAGTYYCAVTVCGRIVFGNGTRLESLELVCGLTVTVLTILRRCLSEIFLGLPLRALTRTVPVVFQFLTMFLTVETESLNRWDSFLYPSPKP
uniref:Ig-like domain-containing protein n=1 Tax=Gouania willdenowi TaxID=441366 RepID=A0A8C5HNC6_GOUWI